MRANQFLLISARLALLGIRAQSDPLKGIRAPRQSNQRIRRKRARWGNRLATSGH